MSQVARQWEVGSDSFSTLRTAATLERVKISLSPSLPHGRVVNEDEVRAQVERVNPILDLLLAPSLTFVPTGAEPRVEGSVTREDRANAQRAAAYSRNDVAVRIPLENV